MGPEFKFKMNSRMVESAQRIERQISSLPLYKMSTFYTIATDPTSATFLFSNPQHRVRAKALETAFAAGFISLEAYEREFPNVFYLTVNAHYDVSLIVPLLFALNNSSIPHDNVFSPSQYPGLFSNYAGTFLDYDEPSSEPKGTFISDAKSLLRPDLEEFLTHINIELCRGSGSKYTADDGRYSSDLVLSIAVSPKGTVSGVWRGPIYHKNGLHIKRGDDILRTLDDLTEFVMSNNTRKKT